MWPVGSMLVSPDIRDVYYAHKCISYHTDEVLPQPPVRYVSNYYQIREDRISVSKRIESKVLHVFDCLPAQRANFSQGLRPSGRGNNRHVLNLYRRSADRFI